MAKTKRKNRARQATFAGDGFPKPIREIDDAAEEYVTYRDARMAALKEELAAAETLLELMKKHELKNYEYDGKIVSLDETQKVAVKKKKPPKPAYSEPAYE